MSIAGQPQAPRVNLKGGDELPSAYLAPLDGPRGTALVMVSLFHTDLLGCGWFEMQIFFVLSGYRNTRSLVHDDPLPFPRPLRRFYARRALRILPLYLVYLCALGLLAASIPIPEDLR